MPQEMERLMEERIARNQATFRAANERIGAARASTTSPRQCRSSASAPIPPALRLYA
jgi:hypothetical protein